MPYQIPKDVPFYNDRCIKCKEYPDGDFIFYKNPMERGKLLYLGFENEVNDNYADLPGYDEMDLETICNCFLRNLIHYKDENECMEISSHPFTLEYLKENGILFKFLFDFIASNKKYYPIKKCADLGMHIHINASFLNKKEKIKLARFIYDPANLKFLKFIADTNDARLKEYASFWMDTCPKSEIDELGYLSSIGDNKCFALHFREEIKTIEFRFFHATNSYFKFLVNIEFVHCLAHFCKIESFNNMTVCKFVNCVGINREEYPNLYKFISSLKWMREKG